MEYALLFLLMLPPVLLLDSRVRWTGNGVIDLGVVFSWVVFVYAWFPMLGLVLAQHGFGALQDQRVMDDFPSSEEIVLVGQSYLAFLAGFALIYGWQRSLVTTSIAPVRGDRFQVLVVLGVTAVAFLANYMGKLLFGINEAKSYGESYSQILQYPKVVQQIMSSLAQIEFSVCLAFVVFMMAWKPTLHKYVVVAILGLLLSTVFSGGSRTFGFLLAFAYVVCFSIYVQPIKDKHLLLVGGTSLALFIFAGVFRANNGFDALALTPFQGGEFSSLFINSIDLLRKTAEVGGLNAPGQLFWVDILRFIPQQFLEFEKMDPAIWYVTTYYPEYYEMGGGLAFGAIAESIYGFGVVEAFVRGGLLGAAYAYVVNRCISGRTSPLKVFIYVWFVVMSYQAIRDTTFAIFSRFIFQVLPVIVLVAIGDRVVARQLRDQKPSGDCEQPATGTQS